MDATEANGDDSLKLTREGNLAAFQLAEADLLHSKLLGTGGQICVNGWRGKYLETFM